MPLSVMQVVGNSVIGGAERHVFDLVQGLSQSGIEVEVICPRPGPLTERLAGSAIPIYCLEMVRHWPHDEYVLDRKALQALIALFGEKHPDVVHSHLYSALAQAILSLLTNPARRTAMGTSARQKVAASFTRGRMVRKTLALYQRTSGQKTDE